MYLSCKSDSDLPTHITINKADATDNVCPSALESAQALLRMHLNCRSRGVNYAISALHIELQSTMALCLRTTISSPFYGRYPQ